MAQRAEPFRANSCYPFDLLSYKCGFSTDKVKEAINVNDYLCHGRNAEWEETEDKSGKGYVVFNKLFPWQKYKWD